MCLCFRGFCCREGGGGVDLVAVRYGWLWVWVCVGLGFDLAVGVGVGFDLAVGVGDRFGRGLLGWVWRGWVEKWF